MVFGTCPILVEGNEYIFRIKAVNKSSKGHWNYSIPSEPSDSMIAKIRYMKAFIHQPGMYDIELKKGHTFRYDIWFGGEPPPTVTWEREGTVIQPNERITLELMAKKTVYCERNTVLTVKKADRAADTGTYRIKLTCEGGSLEATGFVNVLDVPSKPRLLKPDEVRAEHVKLSWNPPEDDGGTPILKYLLRMMDLDCNEWITACEVTAPTCAATVKNLKPGHLYRFEVYAINKEGESPPVQSEPVKAEAPYKPPSEPREPGIVDFDNKSVTLRWNKPTDTGGRPITHFIIQKKDKFGGWFDALITDDDNCAATIEELEARVPGLSEGKWYQFRIVAVNKAGESWPSYETKPHLARHKNLAPTIDKGAGGSKSVKVNRMTVWRINVKGEPPPQFTWWKDGQYSTFTFSKYPELCQLFHFHFLKIFRALSIVPLSLSQDIQSFVNCSTFTSQDIQSFVSCSFSLSQDIQSFLSCSLSLSQDIHIVDLQVARLRRATSTRWRRRSTKVAPLPSCRSSKPRCLTRAPTH